MQSEEQQFLNGLEKKLWISADKLRSTLDAAQYKHTVLGLVFLKYVSDSFDIRRTELKGQFQDPGHEYFLDPDDFDGGAESDEYQAEIGEELEQRDYYAETNVFWVPQQARWEFLQNQNKVVITGEIEIGEGSQKKKIRSVGQLIDNALEAIEHDNPKLKGVLNKRYTQLQIDQDPERAAMCAISGKSLDELEQLSPEVQQQLKTTAALFPDALVGSELGEVPEGWGITVLGEILEFNPKRILKKGTLAPYLDMKNVPTQGHLAGDVYLREMASGTKFINGDTLLARITPCLENGKTAYVDFLKEEQVGWGSTEYIIMRPRNGRPMSLGYMIARLDSFRAKAIQTMTGTSGRQRANAQALSELSWIIYPANILKVYDLVAGSFLAKAKANGKQNKTLSVMRNNLLPKLLSGEFMQEEIQSTEGAAA